VTSGAGARRAQCPVTLVLWVVAVGGSSGRASPLSVRGGRDPAPWPRPRAGCGSGGRGLTAAARRGVVAGAPGSGIPALVTRWTRVGVRGRVASTGGNFGEVAQWDSALWSVELCTPGTQLPRSGNPTARPLPDALLI
jgi:hypothetical protein